GASRCREMLFRLNVYFPKKYDTPCFRRTLADQAQILFPHERRAACGAAGAALDGFELRAARRQCGPCCPIAINDVLAQHLIDAWRTQYPQNAWIELSLTAIKQKRSTRLQAFGDGERSGLAPATQQAYLRYVEQLALFTGKSPDLVCLAASNSAYAGKDVRTSFFTALK